MSAMAMSVATLVDRALGEPPPAFHPIALFGSAMTSLEGRIHSDSIVRGAVYTGVGVGVAAVVAAVLRRWFGPFTATVVAGSVAIAGRMLESEVGAVGAALRDDDIEVARTRIGRLVGRSTSDMDEAAIGRAAIETLAENSVDAVTATMFWGTVAGAHGILVHRAVNTMDAMVGHRTVRHERFGRVSARLDDTANWIPARLTGLAVATTTLRGAGPIIRTIRRDARRHPSPNGGVVEAAFATALGVRLGGVNRYGDVVEDRGTLGDGRPPTGADVARAIALARRVQASTLVMCCVVRFVAGRRVSEKRTAR